MVTPSRSICVIALLFGAPIVAAAPVNQEKPAVDCHGDPLPASAMARLGTMRMRHGGDVITSHAFSPDGAMLATAAGGRIYLRETATGKIIRQWAGHNRGMPRLAFSKDGKVIAAAGGEQGVRLWDVATGGEIRRCEGQAAALAFSPDGRHLAGAGQDKMVRLWEVATGEEIRQFGGHDKPLRTVAFSPDGKLLASAGDEKTIRIWDAGTGKEIRTFQHGYDTVWDVFFTPDGKGLLAGGIVTVLIDLDTGKKRWQFNYGGVYCLAMSSDGKVLATPGGDSIYLLEAATGRILREIKGHIDPIYTLAFSPDGKMLASGGYHTAARLWSVPGGQELLSLDAHQDGVCAVAFAPDGKAVVSSAGRDGTARLWQPATGKQLWKAKVWLGLDAAFAPDGRTVAFGSRLFTAAGQPLREVERGYAGGFSPDGKTLAVGTMNGEIELWEAASGKKLRSFETEEETYCVAFSPDGASLASAGGERMIHLWDLATGKVSREWLGEYPFAWSPDGKSIAAGDGNGTVVLTHPATGKAFRRIPCAGRHIAVAFSPDGKTLAVSGGDQLIYLYELATGKERRRFTGHEGRVTALAFSADGKLLASGSRDTTVLIWDLTGSSFHKPLPRKSAEALWTDLISDDSARAYEAVWALASSPEAVSAFLEKHAPRAKTGDPKRIAQLIGELDSNQFEVRQRATLELERLGTLAGPALEEARSRDTSLELRSRIEQLLDRVHGLFLSGEELHTWRAIEVLEHIGDAKACRVLETLAKGVPRARVTDEAQAALRRLAKRAAAAR